MYTWDELYALGQQKPTAAVPPKPEDPATIMYTSGTTGQACSAKCSDWSASMPCKRMQLPDVPNFLEHCWESCRLTEGVS